VAITIIIARALREENANPILDHNAWNIDGVVNATLVNIDIAAFIRIRARNRVSVCYS
jgi:hypothetical protein